MWESVKYECERANAYLPLVLTQERSWLLWLWSAPHTCLRRAQWAQGGLRAETFWNTLRLFHYYPIAVQKYLNSISRSLAHTRTWEAQSILRKVKPFICGVAMSRGAIQKSLWHPIRINTTAASSIFVEFQCLCLVERARRVVGEVSEAERDQHSPLKIWSVVTIFPWKILSLFPTPSPSKSWFVIMGKLLFDHHLDLSSRLLLIRCFEEDQVGENCSQRWGFLWWFSMMIFNDDFQW